MKLLQEEMQIWAETTEIRRKDQLAEIKSKISQPMMQRYIETGEPDQYLFLKNNQSWDFKTIVTLENRAKAIEAIENG